MAEQAPELDETDLEIIELLRQDARRTLADVAERVSLSAPAVKRRVDRLEREGLVRRDPCDSDARGMFAVITDEGYTRLRVATPTHLSGVSRYVVGQLEPDEAFQRRKITVLFADMVGFTDLSESLEPEELALVLNEYLREMTAVAVAHGGALDNFIGDGLRDALDPKLKR